MIHLPLQYPWPIVGNETVLARLEEEFKNENLSHAYLFAGHPQVGKFSCARAMAQLLQCEHRTMCRHCTTCRHIQSKAHLDTLQFDDISSSIKIEEVKYCISYLSLSRQSPYKILIMKNIERMTPEAANALLKTLEEPVRGVIIFLTTTQLHALLPTLISRCRVVSFQTLTDGELVPFLQERFSTIDEQRIARVCAFSMGCPGKALQLLQDDALLRLYEEMYYSLEKFLGDGFLYKRFEFIEEICKPNDASHNKNDGVNKIDIFFDVALHFLRNCLFYRLGYTAQTSGMSLSQHSVSHIADLLRRTLDVQAMMRYNINEKLALENLMLHF